MNLYEANAELRRLEREVRDEEALVVEWEKKAMMAVKAGYDDLAKQALLRKLEHEKLAVKLEMAAVAQRAVLEESRRPRAVAVATPVAVPVTIEDDVDDALLAIKARMGIEHRAEPARQEQQSLDDIENDLGPPGHGLQPYVWAQTKSGLK